MSDASALEAAIAEMLEALQLERAELRARLGPLGDQRRVRVIRGRRLLAEPGAHTYRFDCTLDLPVPDGTAVRLEADGEASGGEVLRLDRDEEHLVVVLKQDLGDTVPEGWVSFDPALLLGLIAGRLRLIADGAADPAAVGPAFFPELGLDLLTGRAPPGPIANLRGEIPEGEGSPAQRAAVAFALGQRVAYIWGPPGTGKTRTLALLVHALRRRGEQVLIVAHTNVATDTALRRVLDGEALPPGAALRLGPCGDALAGRGVGLDEAVDRLLREEAPSLVRQIEAACAAAASRAPHRAAFLTAADMPLPKRLRAAVALLERDQDDPLGLAPTLAVLTTELHDLELVAVARASVLATTLTRALTSALSRSLRPATVIIDEASTAPLVTAFGAAALATRRVVAVGDFLQLAPIAAASAPLVRRWLGTHVFSSAGCDRVASDHPLRVLLDEQWRMHPQIAAVVSRTFYGGRLRDAAQLATRPSRTPAIALCDTATTGAVTTSSAGGSKLNQVHADLVAELALQAAPHQDVAVIAPYRAQVRRIRGLIHARAPGWLQDGRIEVFSVHRFQGRERSLVLFDTVEAPGTAPRFLDELHNPDAPRLVNVALSRAVDRLVLIVHSAHLAALGPTATLGRVLAAARAGGAAELLAGEPADRAELFAMFASGS
jgi:hypothetical protein